MDDVYLHEKNYTYYEYITHECMLIFFERKHELRERKMCGTRFPIN